MLKVKIELWPGGFADARRTLEEIEITNIHLDTETNHADYRISRNYKKAGDLILNWDRSRPVTELVTEALKHLEPLYD